MSDRSYVYLVEPSRDPALFGWQAALAGREAARANVVLIGPSTVEGYPVTSFDRTPAQELARALRGKFPTSGVSSTGGRGRIGMPNQSLSPALPSPLTFVGGTFDPPAYNTVSSRHFGANHTCWYANSSGKNMSMRLKSNETSFDIVHVAGPTGHATGGYYAINGGTHVTFSTYAAANVLTVLHVNVATEGFDEWAIDGGSPASASLIEVGCTGSGYIMVAELITYGSDETSGLMVHGVGHAGFKSSDFAVAPTTVAGWRDSIANLDPDVIVLESGLNDASANTAANFGIGLDALVAAIRSVSGPIATVPILLAAPYDATYGETFVEPWANYVAEMRAVANGDPLIAFCNEGDRMPPTGSMATFSLYHTDHIHGNSSGRAYAMQAHILAEALSFG